MPSDAAITSLDVAPEWLARLSHEVRDELAPPEATTEALGRVSKQFQLWDIRREERELARPKGERLARTHPLETGRRSFERVLADSTREMARFERASALAKRAFVALRALKRSALRKPYKTA